MASTLTLPGSASYIFSAARIAVTVPDPPIPTTRTLVLIVSLFVTLLGSFLKVSIALAGEFPASNAEFKASVTATLTAALEAVAPVIAST